MLTKNGGAPYNTNTTNQIANNRGKGGVIQHNYYKTKVQTKGPHTTQQNYYKQKIITSMRHNKQINLLQNKMISNMTANHTAQIVQTNVLTKGGGKPTMEKNNIAKPHKQNMKPNTCKHIM